MREPKRYSRARDTDPVLAAAARARKRQSVQPPDRVVRHATTALRCREEVPALDPAARSWQRGYRNAFEGKARLSRPRETGCRVARRGDSGLATVTSLVSSLLDCIEDVHIGAPNTIAFAAEEASGVDNVDPPRARWCVASTRPRADQTAATAPVGQQRPRKINGPHPLVLLRPPTSPRCEKSSIPRRIRRIA
jgi:hypothetical protein